MNGYPLSKATLGRLPQYLNYLNGLPEDVITISATTIAKDLSLGDVQVRKDLAIACGSGKPKIGYEKHKLIFALENHLGQKCLTNAVLVGAGKLGQALLDYDGFEKFGVKIIAGFDKNERVIKNDGVSKPVLAIDGLEEYCNEHNVKLGIITVGQGSAQEVCDLLVKSGIKAIWNFAPCTLKISDDVILQQENLALSLAHLNNQLQK